MDDNTRDDAAARGPEDRPDSRAPHDASYSTTRTIALVVGALIAGIVAVVPVLRHAIEGAPAAPNDQVGIIEMSPSPTVSASDAPAVPDPDSP